MLHLYNSLTGRTEPFRPIASPVTMYVCGVTPYDTTHAGHAFTYVVFDVLQRYLRYLGHPLRYVRNITDVDDSLLERARLTHAEYRQLGQQQTEQFEEDMRNLNCLTPDVQPKASQEIPHMIRIVERMLERGAAYVEDGWVYFSVAAFPEYGRLGKYDREHMLHLSAKRGADPNDRRKRDALDFVLWQPSLDDEPAWEAPWGAGRPGWHLECTAMSLRYLGESIDVHGGGSDLIYPHHESEIAQSELYTGAKPFARFWVHTGMVRFQGEKMSKSLGNLVLVRDLLRDHSATAIRLYLLDHCYRDGWDFEPEKMAKYDKIASQIPNAKCQMPNAAGDAIPELDDDLDTPAAIRQLEAALGKGDAHAIATYQAVLGL